MKKVLKQTTATLLLSSFALASCSKNYSTTVYQSDAVSASQEMKQTAESDFNAWKKLITTDEKNIALAEILSSAVAKENRAMVAELVSSLTNEEINQIISSTQEERKTLSRNYLFRGNTALEGKDVFRKSILNDELQATKGQFDSESYQLLSATFSYLKSKSLAEIYASFDKAMEQSSQQVAKAMVIDIAQNNPALAHELEQVAQNASSKEEFSEKLKSSEGYLQKVDEMFKVSGLNTKEQLIAVSVAMVGGAMFVELKQTKTFADLLKKYEDLKPKIEELKAEFKTIKVAVEVIKKNRDEATASLKEFNEGLRGVKDGVKETYDTAKAAMESKDEVKAKDFTDFLYNKVIKGKNVEESKVSPTITAAQKKINDNLNKSMNAAWNMAGNLDNILNTTVKLCFDLNIKIPKDLQKAINTAQKVTAGVKLASTIISGVASGGVLSAVSMLTSGPIGGMLGLGGGTDPAVTAALGRIEAKLDIVLENQQKMMEMQIETIKMIKNLAVMIDDYHQTEMQALAALRDNQIVQMEMQKVSLNQNIRSCEKMIDFKLKTFWGDNVVQKQRNNTTTALDFEKFYSQFGSLGSFRNFARSIGENNYSRCQDAFAEAFGVSSTEESPILSIFTSTENAQLYTFQKEKYLPLVRLYEDLNGNNGYSKKILHLPAKEVSGLETKAMELASGLKDANEFTYNLENLLSTKSLERYLSSLLILYPVFEFDKDDWSKSLPELVDSYYKKLSSDNSSFNVSRGYYFMNNALDMIHSAIAQEAILAGEPLIPGVRAKMAKQLFANDVCGKAGPEGIVCSLRGNRLLMKNYLNYTIQKSISFTLTLEKYQDALNRNDFDTLALYLNNEGVTRDMLMVEDGLIKIRLPVEQRPGGKNFETFTLPRSEAITANTMLYSENMERLIKMQKDTVSALVKLSPSQFRTTESREKFSRMLLFKNF